ncbi:hypothetical protein KM427_00420 [Nocardioides sp. LMS-CY]|uniref:Bacterial Ig-like domain-containing protein n=1 Tax=Nocardioides soli TaxID=1036020 RepID=A0A7W4W163_9ACTN|nr:MULTISPECIES: hypothetical protein [Nocardioides]MBB3045505.1 hypothetical protein [Nocardioides soli]QWF22253.1 hypothetical protein KM427_00420 [Nocardioides sp. LMS-CY]
MRSRVTRLTGVAAGAALVLASLVAAGPANAAGGETGTLNVTIVDDQGKPVNAIVWLVPEEMGEGSPEPFPLEEPEPGKSSYSQEIEVGKYGIVTMGGWSIMSCAGVVSCATPPDEMSLRGDGAVTVTDGGVVNYTVTTATPKLSGNSKVGSALAVDTPILEGLNNLLGGMGGMAEFLGLFGTSFEPTVTWKRDGIAIRGETGATYVTTGEDVGRSITAEVRLPNLLSLMFASMGGGPYEQFGLLPGPATLGPVVVAKNDSTTDVRIVGKRRVGHTPTAWITVKGADRVNGWITVTGTGDKPLKLRLRDGFAKVELNKLRAGKKTVTATFDGTSTLNASSDTATFKMKKAKDGKKKNKNKKSSKKR